MYRNIVDSVFVVGGTGLSDPGDCLVYAVDLGDLVLIDAGMGPGWESIARNMREAGLAPERLHTLILTHGHIDHIGAAAHVKSDTGCRVVAHDQDREAIALGDPERTASDWYGRECAGVKVDLAVAGEREVLEFSKGKLELHHIPGHTPGSMAVVLDNAEGLRVLFGQDIHGPFSASFGSDLQDWRHSMYHLAELQADVLCEGHYGVFRGKDRVRNFIESWLDVHGMPRDSRLSEPAGGKGI